MLRDTLYFEDFVVRLESLVIYRNILDDIAIKELYQLAKSISRENNRASLVERYYRLLSHIVHAAQKNGYSGNIFKKHVCDLFLNDLNIFSVACENKTINKDATLYSIALQDINTMYYIMNFDLKNIADNIGFKENVNDYVNMVPLKNQYIEQLESHDSREELIESLMWYYSNIGSGLFNAYKMFKYDEQDGIVGVNNYDKVTFDDLIGYQEQKNLLINNTNAFLNNSIANNVLLIGPPGTGKSSCVKALANDYYNKGIRLIEVTKEQIAHLPKVLKQLEGLNRKFIIFIDDLSFEDFEVSYKYMKSVLEGSVEVRPDNVLFYATSNRRHIVQEKWSDKNGMLDSEEIHATDATNEKISLSDRFGLTITFPKPSPKEYIDIVLGIAKRQKLNVSEEFLLEQAIKWELNQKSFSGRTAKQYISHVEWELNRH